VGLLCCRRNPIKQAARSFVELIRSDYTYLSRKNVNIEMRVTMRDGEDFGEADVLNDDDG